MKGLKAFTVVIIENALQYETDPSYVLGKFCLKKCNRLKICSTLEALGHGKCATLLKEFFEKFEHTNRKPEIEAKSAETFFKHYLNKECGITNLNEDEVIECIGSLLATDDENAVKTALLKYGILGVEEAGYNQIISEICEVEESEILFYKGDPAAHEVDVFFSEIDEICEQTGSKFCLAIIDKKLGSGDADEEGRSFIIEKIIPANEQRDKKIICCLYTSSPAELIPKEFSDYFIQEISKNSPGKLDDISKTLARSAYAQVFYLINIKYKASSDKALELVLLNQQNIKYIIQESHLEGIPAYEAIKYWFNLAQQYIYEKKEIEDFDFNATLTSFFNQDYVEDHPRVAEIGDDLKALNAFELFDFNLNQKFLPIAPGDIWKTNDSYYILTGQLCDILLRQSENKRGAKLGEFLKAEVTTYRDSGKKYDIEVKGGKKIIWIENFFDVQSNQYETLKIVVATSNIYYADLRVLDLAMFNKDGNCQIAMEGELDNTIKQILPLNKDIYYTKLQAQYPVFVKLKEVEGFDLKAISDPIDFPIYDFKVADGVAVHDIKRVGRLKGRYFDSLYNNYINNKSRIDLNLIDNASETAKTIQLAYKLVSETDYTTVESRVWSRKGKEYIKKEDLHNALGGKYDELTAFYDNVLNLGTSKYFELVKLDETSYQLDMYVYIAASQQPRFHAKSMVNYSQLFNGKPANPKFIFLDNGEEKSFWDEQGANKVSYELAILTRGILVQENGQQVKLNEGIIKFNKADVEAN